MKPIEAWQRRALYGIGHSLGITGRDGDDELHLLINAQTGKSHIGDLSFQEANDIIACLREKTRGGIPSPANRQSGDMNDGQRRRVWQLMYLLQKQDITPSSVSLGERLCGIIRRQLGISTAPIDPFKWLNYKQGTQLIEILKGYVRTAEAKKKRNGACE